MFPPYQTLLVDLAGGVATVTLSNGERNGWSLVVQSELYDVLRRCDGAGDVRAVVLTAAGRCFTVGADMSAGRLGDDGRTLADGIDGRAFLPKDVRKPVIAALNGDAVGAGSTFPLTCDVRLLAEGARLGFVFVRRGILTEYGASWVLPRLVGMGVATDLLVTGRLVHAEEAVRLGLVNRVLPPGEVLAEAQRLAAELVAGTAPLAVGAMKQLLWRNLERSFEEGVEAETQWFSWLGRHPDAREGVMSFVEKRPPQWQGDASALPEHPH